MRQRSMNFVVGLFMLLAIAGLVVLAFGVSGLTQWGKGATYQVVADFDTIGGLRVNAPVRIAGVKVGSIKSISLNPKTFQAQVIIDMDSRYNNIPSDSSARILTQGLLGANYISLSPGFNDTYLRNGSSIDNTQSAMILENLIGQFLFSMKNKGNDKTTAGSAAGAATAVAADKQPGVKPAIGPVQQNSSSAASADASTSVDNTADGTEVDDNKVVTIGG